MNTLPEQSTLFSGWTSIVMLVLISALVLVGCGPEQIPSLVTAVAEPADPSPTPPNAEAVWSATANDTAIVRSGPSAEYPDVDTILRNDVVTVIGHYQCSYFLVVTPDAVEGWVNQQSLAFDFECADIEEITELPPMPEPEAPNESEEEFPTPYSTPSAREEEFAPEELQYLVRLEDTDPFTISITADIAYGLDRKTNTGN